jgi:hypothetical protein
MVVEIYTSIVDDPSLASVYEGDLYYCIMSPIVMDRSFSTLFCSCEFLVCLRARECHCRVHVNRELFSIPAGVVYLYYETYYYG